LFRHDNSYFRLRNIVYSLLLRAGVALFSRGFLPFRSLLLFGPRPFCSFPPLILFRDFPPLQIRFFIKWRSNSPEDDLSSSVLECDADATLFLSPFRCDLDRWCRMVLFVADIFAESEKIVRTSSTSLVLSLRFLFLRF